MCHERETREGATPLIPPHQRVLGILNIGSEVAVEFVAEFKGHGSKVRKMVEDVLRLENKKSEVNDVETWR